ncbi:DUF3048 domain-containing protein [Candidatus Dojkabacteria bacterium]|nr:DUF3048 domain-containing protein [Candidatus Dojkabacteria bacterium]
MRELNLNSGVINQKKREKTSKTLETTAVPKVDENPTKKTPLTERIKKLLKKYQNLPPKKKILVTGLICSIILIIGGISAYFIIFSKEPIKDFTIPERISAKKSTSQYFSNIIPPFPEPPRDKENPINGELYTSKQYSAMEDRYPIAVMIENHVDARPQSGYNSADIVYEALAEGGITRTMAIFWGKECEEIGPIRSARQYFIEWLMPYDPLYMYIGYATSSDPRVNAGQSIYEYGIKGMDVYGTFWRDTTRYSPHNAYSSTELLYQRAKDIGYTGKPGEIKPLKFKMDAAPDKRGSFEKVTITFFERLYNGGLYDVTWVYDSQRNVYLRYNGDDKYIDQNSEQQVFAKNVIIQRMDTISTFDSKAHIIITTIDEGDAIILRDGQTINATWKKKDLESRTRYYDSDGKEIELNRGIIWIESVPIEQGSVTID